MLGRHQISFRPLGVLVGYIRRALAAPKGLWSQGSHQVCENKLESELNLVNGALGVSQLVTLAGGAHIAVWYRPVETHRIDIEVLQEVS